MTDSCSAISPAIPNSCSTDSDAPTGIEVGWCTFGGGGKGETRLLEGVIPIPALLTLGRTNAASFAVLLLMSCSPISLPIIPNSCSTENDVPIGIGVGGKAGMLGWVAGITNGGALGFPN